MTRNDKENQTGIFRTNPEIATCPLQSYYLKMRLDELQREAENLAPDELRKLIGFLVALEVRRDEPGEISRRLDDKNPDNWINLKDARNRLKDHGV